VKTFELQTIVPLSTVGYHKSDYNHWSQNKNYGGIGILGCYTNSKDISLDRICKISYFFRPAGMI